MTSFYIDISNYQAGINLSGWHAVCGKASEGSGWADPSFATFRMHAAGVGAYFFGYHFLHEGNGAGQADFYFGHAGRTPCMIDFEPTAGSNPQIGDAVAFAQRLRSRGCPCELIYCPRWYWGNLGSPSLGPVSELGLKLVSSSYSAYSDSGPGWNPYGGMVPQIWQYTSTLSTGGYRQVDCNAYKGSFAQLAAMAGGAAPSPVPQPPPKPGVVPDCRGRAAGRAFNLLNAAELKPAFPPGQQPSQICTSTVPGPGAVLALHAEVQMPAATAPQIAPGASGQWALLAQLDLNRAGAGIRTDSSFGPATAAAVEHFQSSHGLAADGIVGPATWNALGAL